MKTSMNKVSSGAEIIDALLEGGYEKDTITSIYGPSGSGKTNLAILAAVEAVKHGKKAIFVDTEGGFSVTRFEQIADKKFLDKIIFLNPTNFKEQKEDFEKLKKLVNDKIGLIVVDTLTTLYRLERTSGDNEFHRELGLQIAALTEIARKKNIPVLCLNQVYAKFDTNAVQVVGGDFVKFGSKCLIELQSGNNGLRKAILRKHRSIPGEKEVAFRIVKSGIESA